MRPSVTPQKIRNTLSMLSTAAAQAATAGTTKRGHGSIPEKYTENFLSNISKRTLQRCNLGNPTNRNEATKIGATRVNIFIECI